MYTYIYIYTVCVCEYVYIYIYMWCIYIYTVDDLQQFTKLKEGYLAMVPYTNGHL